MSKNDLISLIGGAGAALVFLGCGGSQERSYSSLSEINRPGDSSVVAAAAVPRDAADIRVRSNAEAGLYYISYRTADDMYSVRSLKLKRVERGAYQVSRNSVGFGLSLPVNVDIYFRCRPLDGPVEVTASRRYEVNLLGNDNGRQFQWNQIHDDDLAEELCGGSP